MSDKIRIQAETFFTEDLQTEAGDSILQEEGSPISLQTQTTFTSLAGTIAAQSSTQTDLGLNYSLLAGGAQLEQNEPALTINAVLQGTIAARTQFGVYQGLLTEDGQPILIDPDTPLGIELRETPLKATARLDGTIAANSDLQGETRLTYTLYAQPAELALTSDPDAIKVEQELVHTTGVLLTGTFTGSGSILFDKLTSTGVASLEAGVARTGFNEFYIYATGTTTIPPSGINPKEIPFRNRQQLRATYGWGSKDLTPVRPPGCIPEYIPS